MSADEILALIHKARDEGIKANQVVINNHMDATDRALSQLAARRIILGEVADGANPLQVAR